MSGACASRPSTGGNSSTRPSAPSPATASASAARASGRSSCAATRAGLASLRRRSGSAGCTTLSGSLRSPSVSSSCASVRASARASQPSSAGRSTTASSGGREHVGPRHGAERVVGDAQRAGHARQQPVGGEAARHREPLGREPAGQPQHRGFDLPLRAIDLLAAAEELRVRMRGCAAPVQREPLAREQHVAAQPVAPGQLLIPDPKKTGVCRPCRNSSMSNGWLALRISSTSWRTAAMSSGKSASRRGLREAFDQLGVVPHALLTRREPLQALAQEIEHAAKTLAHPDRPAHRRAVDAEHAFDLLEERDRRTNLAVHLVDECDDGRSAEPAYFQQLDRLRLDPLCRVDHHHRGIDRGQHAIGVFREVLVAGGVEEIDRVTFVVELHHGARHRDSALLLDFHPIGRRMPPALARLDGAGHLDRAAVEQQLFRQRRLPGVRVRNDRERPALGDIVDEVGRKGEAVHRPYQLAVLRSIHWAKACMNFVRNSRV